MDSQTAIPRPSGIPKPPSSRLPVLRPTGSQSSLRTPSSTEQLRKKPSIPSISRPGQPLSGLQRKTSRPSLGLSTTPSTTAPVNSASKRTSLISSARRTSGIPSIGPTRATPATNNAPVFKRPFARPPSRQTTAPPQSTPTSSVAREDDALGSLDGFRSASRASSRAGSRTGFYDDGPVPEPEPEYVLQDEPEVKGASSRKSRPSLSDRTIESLSQLPSSPAGGKTRRRSSFFSADNTMPPPLRPASAMSNSSRSNSRPTTSDGPPTPVSLATPKRLSIATKRLSMTVPGKRSVSASVTTPLATPSKPTPASRNLSTVKKLPLSQVQNTLNTPKARPLSNSKSMIARTPKSRPSLGGVFGQAISPTSVKAPAITTPQPNASAAAKKSPDTSRKISSSSTALREQIAKAKAARKSDVTSTPVEPPPTPKSGSSSNALREQIAKAREAAKRTKAEPQRSSTPSRDAIIPDPVEIAGFDFGLDDDPFNQNEKGGKSLLRKRIDGARVDGRLNIAAMGIKQIPDDILTMYQYDPNETSVTWGEVVDITVIIAADNELEVIPNEMFPDVNFEDMVDSDENGPQFGGVQTLDLHGNLLQELPMGLKRLTQLSKLNLSRNKLSVEGLGVIAQILSLRELKLAEIGLRGDLSAVLGNLDMLEVLELQNNELTSLPLELGKLNHLRSLNVSSNKLKSIPMEVFTSLIELRASKNHLDGTLFSIDSVPNLQALHLANNSIMSFCIENSINLPALRTLDLSSNKLTTLPDISAWTSLNTLLLGENKLSSLPEGFTSLTAELRTADFSSNDITRLDEKIALMGGLQTLTIAANPLRERKFLSMSTEDIQRELSSRLQREEVYTTDPDGISGLDMAQNVDSSVTVGWEVAPSGTLDLKSKGLSTLDEENVKAIAAQCRQLYLPQNAFEAIPTTLSHLTQLTVLDLSSNNITSALSAPLEFPKLKDLRLSKNKITSFIPLTTQLTAPSLQILDVSHNRLSGSLFPLRSFFPELITLLASDNSLSDVSAESLTGFRVVNLSNNDIERLEPRIGLLQGTLTGLEVEGNKFRVPSYHILRKGTDTVLTWLRDKIPRESWKSDGTEPEFFDAVDG